MEIYERTPMIVRIDELKPGEVFKFLDSTCMVAYDRTAEEEKGTVWAVNLDNGSLDAWMGETEAIKMGSKITTWKMCK